MAAALVNFSSNEIEDLVTCSVCLQEFDDALRKAKFLPCSHTLCLQCLKNLHKESLITCPLCRSTCALSGDVTTLPNNPYALLILKSKGTNNRRPQPVKKMELTEVTSWCQVCGVVAKASCTAANHKCVNKYKINSSSTPPAAATNKGEDIASLKSDLMKLKELSQSKLAQAIDKTKEVQCHLDLVLKSLKMSERDVKEMYDHNSALLSEMTAMMEAKKASPPPQSVGMAELLALVEDSKADDSHDTLRRKMQKSVDKCDEKLARASQKVVDLQKQKKTRIAVRLYDEKNQVIPTWGLLDGGFNICWPRDAPLTPTRRDFLLLSHVVASIQKRNRSDYLNNKTTTADRKPFPAIASAPAPAHGLGGASKHSTTSKEEAEASGSTNAAAADSLPTLLQALLKEESRRPTPTVSVPQPTAVAAAIATVAPVARLSDSGGPPKNYSAALTRSPPAKYIAGHSIFILTLKYYGSPEGQVHIKPSTSFYPSFVQQLGDFCFRAPKEFSQAIDKAVPGVFLLLPCTNATFQPSVPNMADDFGQNHDYDTEELARKPGDVGVMSLEVLKGERRTVTGWSFLFPLDRFCEPKYAMHLKPLTPATFFGRILKGIDVLADLTMANREERKGYTFTLESK